MTRQVVQAAIGEIATSLGDQKPPGFSTLCKWAKRSGTELDIRCLVGRDNAKGRGSWLNKMSADIMISIVRSEYMTTQCISIVETHRKIQCQIQKENDFRSKDDVIPYPSMSTVYRAVRKLDRRDIEEARHGKRSAAHKFNPVRERKDPEHPLDLVEMDHTPLDLFVVDDEHMLPIGRPWITLATDRCTRIPLGWYIGFEPPSIHSVMQCLRFAILPKPDFNVIFSGKVISYWNEQLAGLIDDFRIVNECPYHGFPRELSLDRGMEFISTDLADFCGSQGIDPQNAPRKKPEYKGSIERFFGTINTRLLHNLKGTTFSNIFARGDEYDPAKNAVIPFTILQWLVCKFFIDIFSLDKHDGLKGIPKQCWLQKTQTSPVRCIHDLTELDMLMGKSESRVLQRTGIEFENLFYISDELVSWLRDPSFYEISPDRRIKLKYDPSDIASIRVLDPRSNRYLVVPVTETAREYTTGLSMWVHQRLIEKRNEDIEAARDIEGLIRARRQMEAVLSALWSGRGGKVTARKAAARAIGIGRTALGVPSTPLALPPLTDSPGATKKVPPVAETPMELLAILRGSQPMPVPVDAVDDDDFYAKVGAFKPPAPKDSR